MNFLKPALGVFLLPLYLNELTDAEYGLYGLMASLSIFVSILATLRVNAAMSTFYYDFNENMEKVRDYLSQIFSLSVYMGSFFFALSLILGPKLFTLFKNEISFYPLGFIVLITGVLQACNSVYYVFLKNELRFTYHSMILLFHVIVSVLIQIILILIYKQGVIGLLLGHMVPTLLVFIYILIKEKGIFTSRVNFKIVKPSLKFSVALVPFVLILWIINKGDKTILEQYISLADLGKYNLLMTVALLLVTISAAILNAFRPFLYKMFQDGVEKNKARINLLIKCYMGMTLLGAGAILLIGSNLDLITSNKSFLDVIPFFLFATTLTYFRSYVFLFTMQLNFVKRSKEISVISVISLILLLLLYHNFASQYGLSGVFFSGITTAVVTSSLFYFGAQKYFHLPYNVVDLWVLPLIFLLLLYAANFGLQLDIRIKSGLFFIISIVGFMMILRGSYGDLFNYFKKEFNPRT